MRLAKIHHPDKNGGNSEKVNLLIMEVYKNWISI
jgi:hypothetical protein